MEETNFFFNTIFLLSLLPSLPLTLPPSLPPALPPTFPSFLPTPLSPPYPPHPYITSPPYPPSSLSSCSFITITHLGKDFVFLAHAYSRSPFVTNIHPSNPVFTTSSVIRANRGCSKGGDYDEEMKVR